MLIREHALAEREVLVQVVRMRNLRPGFCAQLVVGVANQIAEGLISVLESPVHRVVRNSDRRVLDEGPIAVLALA